MANVAIKIAELKADFNPICKVKVEEILAKHNKRGWAQMTHGERWCLISQLEKGCHLCPLCYESVGPIVPRYEERPQLLAVGRNPGKGDDVFSEIMSEDYPAGQVFSKYLRTLGIPRSKTFVTNVVKCRTPKNGPPTPTQCSVCSGWLQMELESIDVPQFILAMGNDALRVFMGPSFPAVQRIYGDLYLVNFFNKPTLIVPVQHPGFILRHPEEFPNTELLLKQVAEIIHDPAKFNLIGVSPIVP